MSYNLTPRQKEEIRRLTQKVNRRILTTEKQFRKEGYEILPRDVVGKYQTRDTWETKGKPLSRSVKFGTKEEYQQRIKFLREFERGGSRPTLTEYTKTERTKLRQALQSAIGDQLPPSMEEKIKRLSAPQLKEFWGTFSEKASRVGLQYSSTQVMADTLEEFFPEDFENVTNI